jgi:nitrous oxidase accessory protein NosD
LQNNEIATFLTGAPITSIQQNIMKNNNIAMASHSGRGINVNDNLIEENPLAGDTLVNTDESAINGNRIQGSQNGVILDSQSTGNTVQLNNAHDNVVDINNANGLGPTVNQKTCSRTTTAKYRIQAGYVSEDERPNYLIKSARESKSSE